jgi:hypothetical protein
MDPFSWITEANITVFEWCCVFRIKTTRLPRYVNYVMTTLIVAGSRLLGELSETACNSFL